MSRGLPLCNAGTRTPIPRSCLALLSLPCDAAGDQPGRIRGAARSRVSWGRVNFPGVFAPPRADVPLAFYSRRSRVTVPPEWQWPVAGPVPLALPATSVRPRRSENPVSGTRLPRRRERGRHADPSPPLPKQPRGGRGDGQGAPPSVRGELALAGRPEARAHGLRAGPFRFVPRGGDRNPLGISDRAGPSPPPSPPVLPGSLDAPA